MPNRSFAAKLDRDFDTGFFALALFEILFEVGYTTAGEVFPIDSEMLDHVIELVVELGSALNMRGLGWRGVIVILGVIVMCLFVLTGE